MKAKFFSIMVVLLLVLSACAPKNPTDAGQSGTASQQESNSSNGSSPSAKDLSGALNVVLGSNDNPSVFPSYHIDLVLNTPTANDDYTAIVNETLSIQADVQGKNVHIIQTDPGATESKEGYIIGDTDKEYKMVDGQPQEMLGQIALGWAMWPLTVVVPYSMAAALYSHHTGSETLNGRSAEVYEIDSAKGDPAALAVMAGTGLIGVSQAAGKVWIDKETGGMLKLELAYTSGISNLAGDTKLGDGQGTITLEISQVGQVSVTSPVQ